ncbi:heme oxygenase 1, chloroplastic-like [Nymphaea colorata]|nr:heme oxygenase 1, chloroplastic-like [Nymphaea colorata]
MAARGGKTFVEEMRSIAMKFHVGEFMDGKWEPTLEGYLQSLVDSQIVFATLENIVLEAKHLAYVELRNTGLERKEKIEKDVIWFQEQGYPIPTPSPSGIAYSSYLEGISMGDPAAFVCHFYNIYFAHTAGGRIIGKKVSNKLLKNHELNFYKWDGELGQLMQNARERLNQIAQNWSTEERRHCLEETKTSFHYSLQILNSIWR